MYYILGVQGVAGRDNVADHVDPAGQHQQLPAPGGLHKGTV